MSNKWNRRDKKRKKARYGMRVSGRSIISIQQALAAKRRRKKGKETSTEPTLWTAASLSE
jgi:hypothetical protein